jgi:hypothetical protein
LVAQVNPEPQESEGEDFVGATVGAVVGAVVGVEVFFAQVAPALPTHFVPEEITQVRAVPLDGLQLTTSPTL